MNRLIQLNPFVPPLHPMLQTFKKQSQKLSENPLSEDELATLTQLLCDFLGVENYSISHIGPTEEVLSENLSSSTVFFNTDRLSADDFPARKDAQTGYFIQAINFSSGKLFKENLPQGNSLIDISGIMPYSDINGFSNRRLMFRLDPSLGIDLQWTVLLEKGGNFPDKLLPQKQAYKDAVRLLNFVFEDYSLQKNLFIRDYKYKAALLENLIATNPNLNFCIKLPTERSKTIFAFSVNESTAKDFKIILKKKGFDVGKEVDGFGNKYFQVANFINHSKEQIEAFVDTVSEIL